MRDAESGFLKWINDHPNELCLIASEHFPSTLQLTPLVEESIGAFYDHLTDHPTELLEFELLLPDPLSEAGRRMLFYRLRPFVEEQIKRLRLDVDRMVSNLVKAMPKLQGFQDDVIQDVLLELCKPNAGFDPDRANEATGHGYSVYSWLKKICANVALRMLRKNRGTFTDFADPSALPSREDSPDNVLEQKEYATRSADIDTRAHKVLTNDVDRAIYQLHFKDGLTVADIAPALNLKPMTVYQRIHRIPQKLRESGMFNDLQP